MSHTVDPAQPASAIPGAITVSVRPDAYGETGALEQRVIPLETPVAIEINGMGYAVMMATPQDVEDFVTGFLIAEGLAKAEEVGSVAIHQVESGDWGAGLVARVNLPADRAAIIVERTRTRVGDSSCGLCGIESIEAALRPLPVLPPASVMAPSVIGRAVAALADHQPLGRATAATHAAAFCDAKGAVLMVREDVGRHNALDKLIGALARSGQSPASGFIVMTSRCSYELVEKTVLAGCPLLVTISAPTALAVQRARAAGLALAVVARGDRMLWVTGPAMAGAERE